MLYGGVPEASNQEAVANFKKAIQLRPDFIDHHLHLGKVYYKTHKYDLARQEFKKYLELLSVEEDDDKHKAEAKRLLERIKNRRIKGRALR